MKKAWQEAFSDGYTNPNAPLTPGEMRILRAQARTNRRRVGPRLIFVDDFAEDSEIIEAPEVALHLGELTHSPLAPGDDEGVVDAEIID